VRKQTSLAVWKNVYLTVKTELPVRKQVFLTEGSALLESEETDFSTKEEEGCPYFRTVFLS
jgi:hypothetical protein